MRLSSLVPRWRVLRPGFAHMDRTLLVAASVLLVIGLIMIYSSTVAAGGGGTAVGFLLRQLMHAAAGVAVGVAIWLYLPVKLLRDNALALALVAIAVLLMVHLPGIGLEKKNGAARWISLGFASLQPVEFTKIAVLAYVCAYCAARRDILGTFKGFMPPLAVVLVADLFLLTQPDFGSAVLLTALTLAVLFIAGASLWLFAAAAAAAAAMGALLVLVSPYRLQRLLAFMDPFGDPLNAGYHQTHSLMAFGSGGWLGRGLGQSVEKWSHLPEAHNDFIISVLAEETGLLGFVAILALYATVFVRAFEIGALAERTGRHFAALLARAIGLLLVLQMFVNIGGNLALLPVKGLTLPLVSYGGSSLVAWLVTIALLQVLAHDNHVDVVRTISATQPAHA